MTSNGWGRDVLKRSIKSQLIISFFVVMLPVVTFLVANNWYAKTVVRDKVSETYRNTLDIFVGHMDSSIEEINQYLFKLAANDTDIGLLNSYKVDSDQYMLTKIRIQNKINRDVGFYNLIHTVFIYREDDIIFSTTPGEYSPVKQLLFEKAPRMVAQERMMQGGHWVLWQDDLMRGRDFLVRVSPASSGLYVGAIINIGDILNGLRVQWDKDKIGESAVYRREGIRMTEPLSFTDPNLPLAHLSLVSAPYQMAEDKATGNRYLVMIRSSENADLAISVAVPERTMLQGLPYFQRAVYFIAFGLIFIFAIYLFFIRKMLFQPLQQLIAGMKKLSLGMLDFRLQTTDTVEFVFLANTFNNMAEQISKLRIGVYEEQLRAQKNEMKQLQAQINPHFYMNSLNIIYNFAALKDHESVKKMSLHLADYFRFIMRVNREAITLEEELKHIDNYIEIQKFRFPDKLEYIVDIPERFRTVTLPALSLQPFVENAIVHGFVNRREPFVVRISGSPLHAGGRTHLLIVIQDNGIGFAPEVLQLLNRREELPQSAHSSRLGITNVLQRLSLRFDGASDTVFGNQEDGNGAVIRIRLPLPADFIDTEGEEQRHVQSAGRR